MLFALSGTSAISLLFFQTYGCIYDTVTLGSINYTPPKFVILRWQRMSKNQQRINRLKEVLESDDCNMTDSEKAELTELVNMDVTPMMEKFVWGAIREILKKGGHETLYDELKGIDPVLADMAEDSDAMSLILMNFYKEFERHLFQKGKNGIFAPFANAEDFAKQTIDEIIRRKRGKHE